ncbi:hypothetical protein BU24DRAFT_154524 [Aaosphaeria arxii CBS 175.79]|uniref:BZIP domain-containing protein n=1 Tax=Aaosphaeria arxii CBS 175.79 TaxID=1450172 RepID=A0A6A5XWC9_9PLEO|nr:uncharacterized protein BU24DRAFT_154524 [Aaosphaeria arxii CBS 175.79]KAF2017628.1 hypothetical protein BU24DRAFT_154524 [Aaosphaeria arxii CBS 175.79]
MASSEDDGHPPPRKRSRTDSKNGEESSGKKARGRPRVDTQDATAADRRRTQIRLAQRAYRQRKETTISSLKNKNSRLQSIIDQMNTAFLQFNEAALRSGAIQMNPALAHELKRATESFVKLARTASEGDDDGDDEGAFEDGDPVFEAGTGSTKTTATIGSVDATQHPQTTSQTVPRHTDLGWGYSTILNTPSSRSNSVSPPQYDGPTEQSYYPTMASSMADSSIVSTRPRLTIGQTMDQNRLQGYGSTEELPFGLIDLMSPGSGLPRPHQQPQVFRVDVPTSIINTPPLKQPSPPFLSSISTRSVKPDWTYSHDEVTFARRLTRSALEAAFHMLSNAQQRPIAANFIFRLTLPYLTLDGLRDQLKTILARGVDEDLDCWDTPFIHLGGAGTHYPRRDHLGNITPIPNAWNIRSIGPFPKSWVRAENAVDPTLSHDITVDLTGYEGEWFDSHDVEGYLEENHGCRINPQSSFAEVFVDADEPLSTEDSSSSLPVSGSADMNLASNTANSTSPSLSNGGSTLDSTSANSTPSQTNLDILSQETYGLDMRMGLPNGTLKLGGMDVSIAFDQPLGLDLAPMFNNGNTNNATDGLRFGSVQNDSSLSHTPIAKKKRKQTALIDVSKLVNELIKHAICLGRTPGFRRKDVDAAFKASLIRAF